MTSRGSSSDRAALLPVLGMLGVSSGVSVVVLACVLGGATLGGLNGCAKPLLSPRESRTQYDNYRRSRNEYAPQYITDEWGVNTPNLRGRLVQD